MPRPRARALTMCDLIDTTIDEVRALATRLRPGVLDDFGLIDALDWYTKYFAQRTGITCIYKHLNMPQVDDLVATAAYRITQEALTNVARHAFATRVKIDLQVKRGRVDPIRGGQWPRLRSPEVVGVRLPGIGGHARARQSVGRPPGTAV